MKKIIAVAALSVCALGITSCAPSISVTEAREIAAGIRSVSDSNGDYIGGPSFAVKYSVSKESTSGADVYRETTKGDVKIDLTNYYYLGDYEEELYVKVDGQEAKTSTRVLTEGWIDNKESATLTYKVTIDGVVTEDEVYTFDLKEGAFDEYVETLEEAYEEISGIFENAITMIFRIINFSDEILAQEGIKLGSYGEGSLVITENISQGPASSNTVVEFKDFKLAKMESHVKGSEKGVTINNNLLYTFEYGSYNK